MAKRKSEYIEPYQYKVNVRGEDVDFGFDGFDTMVLFRGSFSIRFPKIVTLDEVKEDIIQNYDEYEKEDLVSFYRANGFYD